MAIEIEDWSLVPADEFYVLPNQTSPWPNVYVERYGYVTDHVPQGDLRTDPDHWDGLFSDPEAFRDSWVPRQGPLELVHTLAEQKRLSEGQGSKFRVISLGAGLGDFTVDLATLPGVHVTHVDFSQQANSIAQRRAETNGIPDASLRIITQDNGTFLRQAAAEEPVDMVFIYGGLGENTPLEKDVEGIIEQSSDVLRPGGHLWYVGLQNEFLLQPNERPATILVQPQPGEALNVRHLFPTDILGEYPTRPGVVQRALPNTMSIVREEHGARPDSHPLEQGGESIPHMHDIQRLVAVKAFADGTFPQTPRFGFKDAIKPTWQTTWNNLTQARRTR